MRWIAVCLVAAAAVMPLSACVAAADTDAVFSFDPALNKSVTYSANGLRLAEVLSQLSGQTGVTMTAGANENDWMVYDRKLIIHVTDIKLRDLMEEISGVLSFVWRRSEENGKVVFRMLSDDTVESKNRALLKEAEEEKSRQNRDRRERAISEIVDLTNLPAAEREKLKSSKPWSYLLAAEPLGRDTALFLKSHAGAREAFLSGSRYSIATAALPAELQAAVRRIAESYDSLTRKIGASEGHANLLAGFGKLQITINRLPLDAADVFTRAMLGSISIVGSNQDTIDIPILDSDSAVARAMGTAILKLQSGVSKEEVSKFLEREFQAAAEKSSGVAEPPGDIGSDPDLLKPVELYKSDTPATLTDTLRLLAEKSGLNVVSDYFRSAPVLVTGGRRPLRQQLEAIRAAFGSNWEKRGKVLRFRDSQWLRKRTWEIPQVWIDYWVDRGSGRQGLGLEELVQIAKLRDEQIDHTVMLSPELLRIGAGEAARNRLILRFYASLDDAQRAQIASQQLPVMALTDDQWDRLRAALESQGAAYLALQRGQQGIRLSRSGSLAADYVFTFRPEGDDPPVVFTVSTGIALQPGEQLPPPNTVR